DPYLPWDRWWWTRMFDAGVSWIRIGQYENSSEPTSWDWVEQRRGVYAAPPGLDDYVDSLVDNGVKVQVQLLYGNPMYTSPAGRRPDAIAPEPGSFHNDDRSLYSIFWPPKTPAQIAAFIHYVKWMANHFRGRIRGRVPVQTPRVRAQLSRHQARYPVLGRRIQLHPFLEGIG